MWRKKALEIDNEDNYPTTRSSGCPDRVNSNAKIYRIKSTADQLSLALGCRDEDILTASLVLHPHRAPRISVHPWNQNANIQDNERLANSMQSYLLTGYPNQWMPPFGLPHLLETRDLNISPRIPMLIYSRWNPIWVDGDHAEELVSLTDYAHWSRVFASLIDSQQPTCEHKQHPKKLLLTSH